MLNGNEYLKSIQDSIKTNEYFYQQFSRDNENVITGICQFDFVRCIYDIFNKDHGYPHFKHGPHKWTIPIIEKIIKDVQFRDALFDKKVEDTKLADIISWLLCFSHETFLQHGLWDESYPQEISSFLEENLSDELLQIRRRCWW